MSATTVSLMAKVTLNRDVTISRWKVKQSVAQPAEEGFEVALLVKRIICCTRLQSIKMNFLGICVCIRTKRSELTFPQEEAGE